MSCPQCNGELTQVGDFWICPKHGQVTLEQPFVPMRIFFSYGHDSNEALVLQIKKDLEKRGHQVWFDKKDIKNFDDWRHSITDGIVRSHRVMAFLSKHSTRSPGVCLDEIAIAIGVKGGNIKTILTECETDINPPASISHIQWMDMHDWHERQAKGDNEWLDWYQEKLDEIIRVVESDESRQFAGEIETLGKHLKPISSDTRISSLLRKGFVGREWLTKAVEDWCLTENRDSRLFWIMGAPGVGKSAFAAQLAHFGRDTIIAAQFCEWDKPDHRNAQRVVRSIAFQLAARLPDYRKLLLQLPEINSLDAKTESELFDYLLADPLSTVIDGGRARYLILIDALDEAVIDGRNPLVEMLAQNTNRLPDWLGLIITSRPEKNVTGPLQGLNPYILDTSTETNREDIRHYLRKQLSNKLTTNANERIEHILEKSEGVFLYVERVCEDIEKGLLSLNDINNFPKGLGGIFWQFFQRQFPDQERFKKENRPALRAILAARAPLPLDILQKLFDWQDEELRDLTHALGSLFPVTQLNNNDTIRPYHKSIIDWLNDENAAGAYYISINEGHQLLAKFGYQHYVQQGADALHPYFIHNLPAHCITVQKWQALETLLADLLFIQAKCAAGMTYDLIVDYDAALSALPHNSEEKRKEAAYDERIKRYTQDLIAYTRKNIDHLDIISSFKPWSEKTLKVKALQLQSSSSGSDRIKVFRQFVNFESQGLSEFGTRPHYCLQQAYNTANAGPVTSTADSVLKSIKNAMAILCEPSYARPIYNPCSPALKILEGHTGNVTSVAILPNGRFALSASTDTTLRLWDLNSSECIHIFSGHKRPISRISVTPSGYFGASLDTGEMGPGDHGDIICLTKAKINIWDLSDYKLVKTYTQDNLNGNVALLPDNIQMLSVGLEDSGSRLSNDYVFYLSNTYTGEIVLKKYLDLYDSEHDYVIPRLSVNFSFTPRCELIAFAGFNKVIIYDTATDKMTDFSQRQISSDCICLTVNGEWLISSHSNHDIGIWDVKKHQLLKALKGHQDKINSICVTADGNYLLSASSDTTVRYWDLVRGELIGIFEGHKEAVNSVSITPNGKYAVSGSNDSTVRLWDLENSRGEIALKVMQSTIKQDEALDLQYSLLEKLLSTIKTSNILIRGINLFSEQSKYVLIGSGAICLNNLKSNWEKIEKNKSIHIVQRPEHDVGITWSENRRSFSIFDVKRDRELLLFDSHICFIKAISISFDFRIAISSSLDKYLILWDLSNNRVILRNLVGHDGVVNCVALGPDSRYAVSGGEDNTIRVWDLLKGQCIRILKGHSSAILAVSITPDGRMVVSTSSDRTLRVWHIKSGKCLYLFKYPEVIKTFYEIWNDGYFAQSYVFYNEQVVILQLQNSPIKANSITPSRDWCHIDRCWKEEITAECASCSMSFKVSPVILKEIETINHENHITLAQSSCLTLPDESWDAPLLNTSCPHCGIKLKLNPFIADSSKIMPLYENEEEATSKIEKPDPDFSTASGVVGGGKAAVISVGIICPICGGRSLGTADWQISHVVCEECGYEWQR